MSQGITAPFQKDEEPRPAGIILELVKQGNWLIPNDLYGDPTRKPPLYYWLGALIARLRGGVVDEAGVRAVSLMAAAAIAGSAVAYTCAYVDTSVAWLVLLFLLATYGFSSRATLMRTDMLLTCFLFGSYCTLYPLLEGPISIPRIVAAGVLLGLAVMTKGPLAIALLVLALAIYAVLSRTSFIKMLSSSWLWIVLGVAAGIGALWYVPAFLQDPQLFRIQILEENFGHLMPSELGGIGEAARPFYYEWLRIIGAALPLILYLPAALARLTSERNSRDPAVYQLALMLAVLAVFTFGNSKRDIYILPALPPLAIVLIEPFTPSIVAARPRLASILTKGASTVSGSAFLIIALSSLCLAYHPALLGRLTMQSNDAAYLQLTLREFAASSFRFVVITLTIIVSSIAALMLVKADRSHAAGVTIGIASLAGVSLWIGLLKPDLSLRRTLKPFALLAQPIVAGHPLYGALPREYELSYYLGRAIPGWRRSMLRPASRCASYLIVRSKQLTGVFPDATMVPRLLLQYDAGDSGGPVLLLNVGGPDLSAGCAEH